MKNKKHKKLSALFLALVMIFMMGVTAFAEDGITYTDFPFAGMATTSLTFTGNNRLTQDLEWTPTNVQMISSGKTCRLDLNGHTLTIKSSAYSAFGFLYVNGGTLIIEDSSEAQTGKIILDSDSNANVNNGLIGVYNGGSVIITGGMVECAKANLYPLYINEGTAEITNGKIISSNNTSAVYLYKNSLTLNSGEIRSDSASPITAGAEASIDITGGNVSYPENSELISPRNNSYPQTVSISGGTFTTQVPDGYCANGYTPTLVTIDQAGNKGYSVHTEHVGGTATCVSKAVCELCNQEYGDFNDSVHGNLEKTEGKAATCTETGYEAYWTCIDCGKMFSDENGTTKITAPVTTSITEHSFGAWTVTTQPTETKKGEKQRVCTVCGYKVTESIAATGSAANTNAASSANTDTDIPKTGDNSGFMLWMTLIVIASAGLAGIVLYSGKRKIN